MRRYEFEEKYLWGRGWTRLYLIRLGKVYRFKGKNIPSVAVVLATEKFDRSEKYKLLLAPGTSVLHIVPPERGDWGDWYESWADLAHDLGVTVEEAKRFAAEEYPWHAERLDAIEEFMREYAG